MNKYIIMLHNAFIFFSVGRYDVKGKQLLKTLGKTILSIWASAICCWDIVMRIEVISSKTSYSPELIRRDYRVYIGKFGETEIDFVAEKPNDKLYIG